MPLCGWIFVSFEKKMRVVMVKRKSAKEDGKRMEKEEKRGRKRMEYCLFGELCLAGAIEM